MPLEPHFTHTMCCRVLQTHAAQQNDPPNRYVYSITSSTTWRRCTGTSRPNVFAVLRLITNCYLVDTCTAMPACFSPSRNRSRPHADKGRSDQAHRTSDPRP